MKGSSLLTTAITVVALVNLPAPAYAQNPPPPSYLGQSPVTDLTQGVYFASLDAEDRSLRRYSGQKLLNTEGADLGTVRDFIIQPATSRVRYVVVSTGGLFGGMGNSLRLVPIEAVRRGARGNLFEVDILQAAWLQSPPFNDRDYVVDRFPSSASQHQEIVQRYRVAGPQMPSLTNNDLTGLIRASVLRGKAVAVGNRKVGDLENIIVDLDEGTVAALLDSSGEFTGTRGKYLVPISRLAFSDTRSNQISTNLTRDDFVAARPSQFTPRPAATAYQPQPVIQQTPPPPEPALTPTGPIIVHVPQNQSPPVEVQVAQPPPATPPRVVYAPAPSAATSTAPVYQAPPPQPEPTSLPSPEPARALPPPPEPVQSLPQPEPVRAPQPEPEPVRPLAPEPVRAPLPPQPEPEPVRTLPPQPEPEPAPALPPPQPARTVPPAPERVPAPLSPPQVSTPRPVAEPAPNNNGPSSHPNELVQDARAARRAIDVDNTLIAENVLVIPENGKVYLRGTVRNEATRLSIDSAVRRVVMHSAIENQITVARTDLMQNPNGNERQTPVVNER